MQIVNSVRVSSGSNTIAMPDKSRADWNHKLESIGQTIDSGQILVAPGCTGRSRMLKTPGRLNDSSGQMAQNRASSLGRKQKRIRLGLTQLRSRQHNPHEIANGNSLRKPEVKPRLGAFQFLCISPGSPTTLRSSGVLMKCLKTRLFHLFPSCELLKN